MILNRFIKIIAIVTSCHSLGAMDSLYTQKDTQTIESTVKNLRAHNISVKDAFLKEADKICMLALEEFIAYYGIIPAERDHVFSIIKDIKQSDPFN